MEVGCGTCDFKSVQLDKLKSHYMTVHGLSYADTRIVCNRYMELAFDQQNDIDKLGELAYRPSSNSNKYRFELYAYIEGLRK